MALCLVPRAPDPAPALSAYARALGLCARDLDETVWCLAHATAESTLDAHRHADAAAIARCHRRADARADDLNDRGLDAQIAFLADLLADHSLRDLLRSLTAA